MKKSILWGIFLFNMVTVGFGDNLKNAYEEGNKMINGLSPKMILPSIVPGFKTDNPKEVQYQNGDLSNSVIPGSHQDVVSFVNGSINKRPRLLIDKTYDPAIKRSVAPSQDSTYTDQSGCQNTYSLKTCSETLEQYSSLKNVSKTADKNLLIKKMNNKDQLSLCDALRKEGCEQIDSKCSVYTPDGACRKFFQTFRCPLKICPSHFQGNDDTKAFCINGDCAVGDYSPSPDFNRAISALSGLADASKNIKDQRIFTGYQLGCRKEFVNYSNCCSDSGWGLDLNLASCNGEEKELGAAKQAGRCFEVGDYCSHSVLRFCTAHKRNYCCFNSKLAKIIQVQGRKQLRVAWGSGKNPDCRGLMPAELQRVNFSQIDFSEFYKDLENQRRLPDSSQVKKTAQDKIQAFYNDSSS